MKNKLKDLGVANGWKETPEVVTNCDHPKEGRVVGNCFVETWCKICGYVYRVDSSG
jgi:hypothetical protein